MQVTSYFSRKSDAGLQVLFVLYKTDGFCIQNITIH